MVGWHHQLNAYEFEQTLGDSGVQRCLVGYSPRGRKESDTTQWLNSNNNPETSAFYQLRSFDLQKMTAPTSKNPKHRGIAKICICPWSKQEAGLRGCSNRPCFHSLPIYICSLKFQILKKKKKKESCRPGSRFILRPTSFGLGVVLRLWSSCWWFLEREE